jgi:hypothetical protein
VDGADQSELLDCQERLTATPTTIADEIHSLPDVLPKLHQVVCLSTVEQIEAFRCSDGTGKAVPDQRGSRVIERHANVQRSLTGSLKMAHFMATITQTDADMLCRAYHLCGSFIVQDVQGVFLGQRSLLHENSAKRSLSAKNESLDKIVFGVDVLIEQLAKDFLIYISADPHHGKLKKACHGRGQTVDQVSVLFNVHKDGSVGQLVQFFFRGVQVHLPGFGCPLGREGSQGQECHEMSLSFGEQQGKNLVQDIRRRGPLGKLIQPIYETSVGLLNMLMPHIHASLMEGILPQKMGFLRLFLVWHGFEGL